MGNNMKPTYEAFLLQQNPLVSQMRSEGRLSNVFTVFKPIKSEEQIVKKHFCSSRLTSILDKRYRDQLMVTTLSTMMDLTCR